MGVSSCSNCGGKMKKYNKYPQCECGEKYCDDCKAIITHGDKMQCVSCTKLASFIKIPTKVLFSWFAEKHSKTIDGIKKEYLSEKLKTGDLLSDSYCFPCKKEISDDDIFDGICSNCFDSE